MTEKDLHIAFVIGSMRAGGAERATVNLINSLIRKNVRIDLVLVERTGEFLLLIDPEINIVDLKSKSSRRSKGNFKEYLKTFQPDMIFAVQNHVQLMVLAAARELNSKARIILNEQSTFSKNIRGLKGFVQRILSKKYFKDASVITAVSSGVADDLKRRFPALSSKIKVIHNPVLNEVVFKLMNEEPEHLWFRSRQRIIVSAGRLIKSKNFSLLIEAFGSMENRKEYKLVIFGEGEYRNELEALIKKMNLGDLVSLPGYEKNPYRYFRAAELFVLSSDYEGLPGVLIEALACGCKCVSTDCENGPAEILENGKYGWLSPVASKELLTSAMQNALSSSADKNKLIERANDFQSDKISNRYLQLFRTIL